MKENHKNANGKSTLLLDTKTLKIVVIFMSIVIVVLLIVLSLFISGNYKINNQETNQVVSFEKKEQCIKYFDSYKNYLVENHEYEIDGLSMRLEDYEMFYNSELDTCISAYSLRGSMTDSNGEHWPYYSFTIVDYLNGQKELYHCREDTYLEHLNGKDVGKKAVECQSNFWKEKDLLKK